MTIHYHGTPITPKVELYKLAGRNFCVSFANPQNIRICHQIGQSVMLDNGAFTFWGKNETPDWGKYYEWCEEWLKFQTTWAVIPDIIDGSEDDNDALVRAWPFGHRGAPVWHLHESIERLVDLACGFQRVCIGSSGQYSTVDDSRWHHRMTEAMNRLCENGYPPCWLHMLRGMSLSGSHYPFASVDSTDIARNHHLPTNDIHKMVYRWDTSQCPSTWTRQPEQMAI